MRLLLLCVLLLAPAADAAERKARAGRAKPAAEKASADAGTADADTVKLADIAVKTPTVDLDPVLAGAFLKVDTQTLPARQRVLARGKQMELRALIKVAEGKKKGGIRMTGPDGCKPPKLTQDDLKWLLNPLLGFVEAQEWAIGEAGTQTECTELDMQCEFSLHIVDMPKGSKPPRRFFFQERDAMLVIVQMKERSINAKQTQFFGTGFLKCQH
ncbi:MAG: hypothetical protein SF051_11330 [Elusimicrobiota bacterium]|nr:hypothetical protein [Elusimicrobiota bacterium]